MSGWLGLGKYLYRDVRKLIWRYLSRYTFELIKCAHNRKRDFQLCNVRFFADCGRNGYLNLLKWRHSRLIFDLPLIKNVLADALYCALIEGIKNDNLEVCIWAFGNGAPRPVYSDCKDIMKGKYLRDNMRRWLHDVSLCKCDMK